MYEHYLAANEMILHQLKKRRSRLSVVLFYVPMIEAEERVHVVQFLDQALLLFCAGVGFHKAGRVSAG